MSRRMVFTQPRPRLCKNAEGYDWAGETSWPGRPASCSDRLHQSANPQNAHHPFHIVGQNVERHFGSYVLESFHLEVRRSHPRLYRTEWMLHSLTAQTHLFRVSIEPRLHDL